MQTLIVAAAVIIEDGRVLLTQRKKGTHLAGMWEFPGGKVEAMEHPESALVRELGEELGIEIVVGEILDVAFHKYEDAGKAVLLLFYVARRRETSPAPIAKEVSAFEWATVDALDERRFPPADVQVLAKVRDKLTR